MHKFIIASVIALSAATGSAQADYYGHRHHYRGGGGGGNWVAPLIGGMVAGGILYGLSQPRAYAAPPAYDYDSAYRVECSYRPVYDAYGRYVGDRRVCERFPNF